MDTIQPKRLSRTHTQQSQTPEQRPKPGAHFFKTLKRVILVMSGFIFCGVGYITYRELHRTFTTRAGKALSWSTATVLSPVVESLPWWFWSGLLGIGGYLWWKHKLTMSIVYGMLLGIYLAM